MSTHIEIAAQLEQELSDAKDEILALRIASADIQKRWIEMRMQKCDAEADLRKAGTKIKKLSYDLMYLHASERELIREVKLLRNEIK